MTTQSHTGNAGNSPYGRALGARLRAVRVEQHLSLHGVQRRSEGRWKAVVVGSYERGDRAISVQRLAELAEFYGVPIVDLLPDTEPTGAASLGGRPPMPTRVVINLKRLRGEQSEPGVADASADSTTEDVDAAGRLEDDQLAPLRRLVERIRSMRHDRSGSTVVLRRSDMEMLAIFYDTDLAGMAARLVQWRVLAPHALILGED